MRRAIRALIATAGLLLALALTNTALAQDSGDLCATPGNLARNCRLNGPYRAQTIGGFTANNVAAEWNAFVVSGSPDYSPPNLCDSPEAPCQRIWSDGGTFEAGLYQQIGVTPGAGYRARIGWFTPGCVNPGNVGRIGIDPTGGTDPNSPRIVWNDWIQLQKSNEFGIHQVKASAVNSTVTLFVSAHINYNCRLNITWMDAIILVPDASAPPAPGMATATFTPAPPTNTPLPRPTATRTKTPVPAPTTPVPPTGTPAPTATVAPTSAPAVALAATETPTPTDSPEPTAAPTRRVTMTPTPQPDMVQSNLDLIGFGLISLSACALFVAAALGTFAYWFWKRK